MKVRKRELFAITAGVYGGDFLVFTSDQPENGSYKTIVLPDIYVRYIKEDDVKLGLKMKILDKVEKIKKFAYNELLKQVKIKELKELNQQVEATNEYYNRREQFTTSDILGSQK